MSPAPRFDDALDAALAWARRHRDALGGEVHLVRDIYGRVRVLAAGGAPPAALIEELHALLGAFSPGVRSIPIDPGIFQPEELHLERAPLAEGVWLVDRLVSEQGWRRPPVAAPGAACPRVVFFGIKGGVGRSTALVALARRLSEQGRRVLVVDLDLESPGATSMLLAAAELPPFGVVDWFVEDSVGQGDDALLRAMVAQSRVGDVLVAPALGARCVPDAHEPSTRDGAFIAKLGRAYASPDGAEFAERLERLLSGLTRVHEPDVLLLDSRAGMHEISAAAVPRLGGTVLLFAGATSQTWLGYRLLFSAWARDREVLAPFRARLRIVAAQVPETSRPDYLERLRLAAYDLFSDFVYDPSDGVSDPEELFNYDVEDPDAPHAPLLVYWRRELTEWEPAAVGRAASDGVTPEQFEAAFGPFLKGVLALPHLGSLVHEPQPHPGEEP